MNFFTYDSLAYYRLGEFIAHTMLNGIVHPDMQLNNIGYRKNDQFTFLDFSSIMQIDIPDCLSADICELLTQCLVPLIEDLKDSFSKMSSFRMGFMAMGGLLGHAIFSNTVTLGVTSLWYTKCEFSLSSYDLSFLYSDPESKLLITNWKNQLLDQITPLKYRSLSEYDHSKERSQILTANRHYLDMLYYSRGYTFWGNQLQTIFPHEDSPRRNNPVLACNIFSFDLSCNFYIERMAETALFNKNYYTAYGLFNRCLTATHIVAEIKERSQDGLSSISKAVHMNSSVGDFIMENLSRDLFELMWILDDLDQNMTLLA